MSVTFRAEGPGSLEAQGRTRTAHLALESSSCPSCSGKLGNASDTNCSTCYGMGGDPEAEDEYMAAQEAETGPSLNVTNMNACALLRVLGFAEEEVDGLCGSTSPDDLLRRIALAEALPTTISREARPFKEFTSVVVTEDGVDEVSRGFDCGLPSERISDDYLPKLRAVAAEAERRGTNVEWS